MNTDVLYNKSRNKEVAFRTSSLVMVIEMMSTFLADTFAVDFGPNAFEINQDSEYCLERVEERYLYAECIIVKECATVLYV